MKQSTIERLLANKGPGDSVSISVSGGSIIELNENQLEITTLVLMALVPHGLTAKVLSNTGIYKSNDYYCREVKYAIK